MLASGYSSSSATAADMIQARTYDVFLSFRGKDTRDGFVSYLYKDLCRKNIETFIDDEELRKGDEISGALLTAIQGSRVSVIVFSEDYASSKWCLAELVKIMDCNKWVVPVFYGVDPRDIRNQTGSFAEAFAKHEENFKHELEKVKTWRSALTAAGKLSGWDSQVTRPESRLIDEIVNDILKKLNRGTSNAYLKGLVGIHRRMEQVMSLIQVGFPDVRRLGIWGMGGTGKTTLAEAIFHHISTGFQSCYFLANVRESEEHGRLFQLRQEFLSTIMEDENLNISTPTIGAGFLKDRLSRKMVLIVCDDVSNSSQLEFLFKGINQLCPGSRVIVTTRNKQVLIQNDIDLIYEMEKLDEDESLQLFCQRAFKSNYPTGYRLELSKMVLSVADGNPLAIKVVGSSLYGKDKTYQESTVKKLKQVPNPDIHKLLICSFDALDCEEKDIFLDIACFFKGENRDDVTRIMDACYVSAHSGIENLIDRSLIYVSQNQIAMHDLLQQMGWNVVCKESPLEPKRRSRLWIPNDIYDVLIENTGAKTLRSMLLDMSRISELELKPEAFVKMRKLKFLKFYHSCGTNSKILLPHGLLSLPDELRYICWEGYPLKTLPTKFHPRNLVELDMSYSHVEKLWEGKQDLVNLKVMTLNHSENLLKIPDLSSATNLENMNLVNCTKLLELPSSLQHLEKLTRLNLRMCENLRFLPSLYKATSLTTLILSDCSILFSFPEVSSNLRELHLEGTAIEQVPSSMESLSQLVLLSMEDCVRLNNFPTAICSLRSLEVFSLNGCPNITTFPEISGNITELNLGGTAIEEVPSSIECFSNLRVFNLGCCRRLKSVSTSIHKLKSLKVFYLEECSKLEIFPEILDTMERLRYLELSGTALKELSSSMENLIGLVELRLNNCENLVYLPDNFYKLKSLKFLYLYGCSNLVTWPDNLFSAIGGVSLTEMRRDLHGLSSLEELDLTGSNLENLPTSIKQLPRLKKLILRKCKRLKSLPELPPSLKHLDAHDCTSLEEVSSIKKPFEQAVLCKDRPYGHLEWIFSNCFQLDQKAVRNTRTPKLQMLFGHMVTLLKDYHQEFPKINKVITCVPGSEIPEWFDFKSSGSSINIQLPSKWYYNSSKNFPTFVVSTVVSFQDYSGDREILIRCKCRLKSRNGDCHDLSCSFLTWTKRIPGSELTGSNHLFLLYKTCFCDEDDEIRWFVETQASNKHMYNEAWFKFHPLVFNGDWSQNICCEVKHCGVHISFAEEEAEVQPSKRFKYQN
ncbi:hypothetical protein ES332_A11G328000v1 [Gossypium tomentosum]|uniref:ADP-ribosyl cyclase/cyclic ADP-ribose hydrolase n=1 Tax=Gossypium tomentosum TaxID=34277 RepID=A0A5D2NHD6_GOSTO|nr:hypothetical protein ES332_A11G328000v1 [Gossypium tomentosum]